MRSFFNKLSFIISRVEKSSYWPIVHLYKLAVIYQHFIVTVTSLLNSSSHKKFKNDDSGDLN